MELTYPVNFIHDFTFDRSLSHAFLTCEIINSEMTYIRENGVHKDDKDKQWSASLRDFALDVMKLTFAINSATAAEGNRRDDKWIDL